MKTTASFRKLLTVLSVFLLLLFPLFLAAQSVRVTGTVVDKNNQALSDVSVTVKNGKNGTKTDSSGRFQLTTRATDVLVFSFTGYSSKEVPIPSSGTIRVTLEESDQSLGEVIVVGYGTQKKGDITGAVTSLSRDRLDMVPNTDVAQAIQGAVPGVSIVTTTAGAAPAQSIMVRGRNSIKASNDPLVVLDGVPYGGNIGDINPQDIASIEILKDASSSAIYGSRGANGVILITSKTGSAGKVLIAYDGKFSTQRYANLPDLMTGPEFYAFKMEREPNYITQTEKDVYESGEYPDWVALATRTGSSQQHNLSASGGNKDLKYYLAGSYLDIKGIQANDNFKRITSRVNMDARITSWLTLGTRTQFSFDDKSGASPSTGVFRMNPLSRPYDADGKLTIYPWPEDIYFPNPLQETLFDNKDISYQVVTNNFAEVELPFIPGLSYRLNTGVRVSMGDYANYSGRNTAAGSETGGMANIKGSLSTNTVVENILSYKKDFGKHSLFATALYSFEQNRENSDELVAKGFPHDFLSWYSSKQANIVQPSYNYSKTVLLSQMLRLNYSYDSRYLLTITGRRDGFSGFGEASKWGVFPSVAAGWNLANEAFFSSKVFNELKLRASWGMNGNQGVGPYETISQLGENDIVANGVTLPGYKPKALGQDNLGWESSSTINVGLDFSMFQGRISGDVNVYKTNTTDLLLSRAISSVHGIVSITQNIGETENKGFELSLTSRNINTQNFKWIMSGNLSFLENKIISLYGMKDENGKELDDVLNGWFIGQPIRVNYGYRMAGVWQLDEADEAATWGSKPGYVKIAEVKEDHVLDANDKQIVGHLDPSVLWGLTNTFSYRNLSLSVFIHGVHGVTRANPLMEDDVYASVRRNTIVKNWWTPDNPTNDFYMNSLDAGKMGGIDFESDDMYFENASFIRLKDVSLSYQFQKKLIERAGFSGARIYFTGRNLFTITKWRGLDPEVDEQRGIPLQKEFVVGINFSL